MNIIKRNGSIEPFYADKIINAITGTMSDLNSEVNFTLAFEISNIIYDKYKYDGVRGTILYTKIVQDNVETLLIEAGREDVAVAMYDYLKIPKYRRNPELNQDDKLTREKLNITHELSHWEIDDLIKENYIKGMEDGKSISNKVDFLEGLSDILKSTKGVGDKLYMRIMTKAQEKKGWVNEVK